MNILSDGVVRLRALEPSDVELLYNWENDPLVWRVSNVHTPISKFMLASYIKTSDRDIWESHELRLVIETIGLDPVGTIELFDFDPFHQRAGVGIIIFSDDERRKGYAARALNLIMDYALNELGIFQLYANIAESNSASLELFQKLRFTQTATKTNWLRLPGVGWESELMFQKLL